MRKILVLLVFLVLLPFSTLAAPNPGHSASQIGAGTFAEEGNYVFPNASKVGINITTPTAALDVRSYSTRGLFVVGSIYSITGTSIDANATGYLGYSFGSLRIGVLGVGNTAGGYFYNPSGTSAYLATSSYGLDVTGDVRWSGTLQGGSVPWARLTSFPSACPAGQYVTAVGSTLTCSAPPAGGNISGSGAATQVAFFTGANTISSDSNLYWDNTNKRLGIGTTSPSYKLDVNGVVSASAFRTRSQTCPSGWSCEVNTWDIAAQSIRAYGNLFVDGNVGIGTTSPSYKLDVNGDTRVTGNLNVGGNIYQKGYNVAGCKKYYTTSTSGIQIPIDFCDNYDACYYTLSWQTGYSVWIASGTYLQDSNNWMSLYIKYNAMATGAWYSYGYNGDSTYEEIVKVESSANHGCRIVDDSALETSATQITLQSIVSGDACYLTICSTTGL